MEAIDPGVAEKIIIANKLIEAMQATGLLPDNCAEFVIHAKCGELVRLDYRVFGDERLLGLASSIFEADDEAEAGTP